MFCACASPSDRLDAFGRRQNFDRAVVVGDPFRHVLFRNAAPLIDGSLHIYLEGDGTPYLTPGMAAVDPTTRQFMMLQLMTLDPGRAVYVGRPCYEEVRNDANCGARYWTSRRFSREVVASLAAVIRAEMGNAAATSVQLFGHSGGGALAVLLSRELPQVRDLLTVAGNLDTDAWSRLHHYNPLMGSLNPRQIILPQPLANRTEHLAGAADDVVPAWLIQQAAAQIGGEVREFAGYTHQCCWTKIWPSILAAHLRQ